MRRVESHVHVLQRDQRAHQQGGADHEDERDRDLDDDKASAQPAGGSRFAPAVAQPCVEVDARGRERRRQPRDECGGDRRQYGEREDPAVDPHVVQPRCGWRRNRQQGL